MNTKTITVAIYPDGSEFVIRKCKFGYEWKSRCYSSHMRYAIENVEFEGGRVERRPNPNYEQPDPAKEIWRYIFG